MTQNVIVAEMVQSNKSENQVWFVHVTGSDLPEHMGYCKHAIKALQFCFILKTRTKFSIDDDTLAQLKAYYAENEKGKLQWYKPRPRKEGEQPTEDTAEQPTEAAAPSAQPAPEHQPAQPTRRRRSKKQTEEVAE